MILWFVKREEGSKEKTKFKVIYIYLFQVQHYTFSFICYSDYKRVEFYVYTYVFCLYILDDTVQLEKNTDRKKEGRIIKARPRPSLGNLPFCYYYFVFRGNLPSFFSVLIVKIMLYLQKNFPLTGESFFMFVD